MGLRELQPGALDSETGELRQRVAAAVHELRTRSGRSLAELAAAAGIGKSTLHAIEAGDANPGIETLWALARALGVPFGTLIEARAPSVRVVRAGEAPRVDSEAATLQAYLMTSTSPGARVELYTLHLEPGGEHDAAPHTDGTTEHLLVTRGRLRVGPEDAPIELGPGDLATFPGDVPHVYDALVPGTHAVLVIEYA